MSNIGMGGENMIVCKKCGKEFEYEVHRIGSPEKSKKQKFIAHIA
jgi:hypothetical protein